MAFGNLFNRVAGSVRGALDRIKREAERAFFDDIPDDGPSRSGSAPPPPPPPSQQSVAGQTPIYFYTTTTGFKSAASSATAGITIHLDQQVSAAMADIIGQTGVDRFREALAPLRRTGELEDSFTYRVSNDNQSISIYSTHPAASSIQYGYETGGSIQSLLDWMEHKPEYSGLSERAQKQAAYFIIGKIKNHHPPGGNSTLSMLSPMGERRYDYLTVVREALENDIETLLDDYVDEINSGV